MRAIFAIALLLFAITNSAHAEVDTEGTASDNGPVVVDTTTTDKPDNDGK